MDTFPDHSKGQVPDMNHRSSHQQTIPIDEDDLNIHHEAYQDHPNESLPSYEEVASSSSATYNNFPTPPSSQAHTRSTHSVSSVSTDSNDPKQQQSGLLSSSTYSRSGGASSNGSSRGAARRSHCGRRGSRSGNYGPETRGYTNQQPMSVHGEVDDSKWDAKKGEPGCCFSDSGGCCFSSRGACCFSDRGGCCFSDREGCCFSDRKGCCFSDSEGCCCSSGKGGCCS